MTTLLAISDGIRRFLERTAFISGWLLVVLAFITCMDVFSRKFGIPIPLTKFQELEWHMHTAIFSFWMGYNYTINAHPRVDSYTESLTYRTRAWIELWGLLIFAIPFMLIMLYHGWDFTKVSILQNEHSENPNGLPFRWLIKLVFYIGLWLVFLGVVSVFLRVIVYLFGDIPEEKVNLQIGHNELEA
jgi:TRAP-type mannitol/chloroaromatic compound transport system permease small subunit